MMKNGMTTNQVISLRILALVAGGMALKEAYNAVMGAGAYEKLASDIYEKLRKS